MQLFFSISIFPSVKLKSWNFPDNLEFVGKIVAKLAGYYTIRAFTERCFRKNYKFDSDYNFMRLSRVEIRKDHRRGKTILFRVDNTLCTLSTASSRSILMQ